MMQIACPWCGMRDEREFVCGGTTHISRPPLECDDGTWAQYLFFRDNPRGMHLERWRHAYGCGMWFNVARDTLTHQIAAVYRMNDPPPVR
jgi:sarcosine oxidase, subunit delta